MCFLNFVFNGNSQVVNIESKRLYSDSSGISGNIGGNFSAVQTANLLYSLGAQSRIQHKSKSNKHNSFILGEFKYTRSSEEIFANSGLLHLRYAYRIKQSPWKWETYYQIQYNELLNQRLRTILGSGIRWKFLDNKGFRFFTGTSFFAEYEEIQPNNQFNRDIRWSNYLSWFIEPTSTLSFTAATYYQPLPYDFSDFRFMGQYALIIKLVKNLSLRTEYTIFHDSKPPEGVRKTIFSSSLGLSYSFD